MKNKIDLKDPTQFTLQGVKELIASVDDSEDRQLRVTKSGIAFIYDSVGPEDTDDLAFRFETWNKGNDYLGVAASQDETWVCRIYKALKKNWPTPTSSCLDSY
jgi:hypothetical protein